MSSEKTSKIDYKELLIKNIRHDFINPINAILGYSDLLIEILAGNDTNIKKDINIIHNCGEKIYSFINESLNYDKAKAKKNIFYIFNNFNFQYLLRTQLETIIGITDLLEDELLILKDDFYEEIENSISRINSSSYQILTLLDKLTLNEGKTIREIVDFYDLKKDKSKKYEFNSQYDILKLPLPKANILVIEDDVNNLELIMKMFASSNNRFYKSQNILDSKIIIKDNKIDLILLDLILPDGNGYDFLNQLKSQSDTYDIPIIILSDIQNVVKCIQSGADDFIFKPINKILLEARIKNSLEKKYFHDKEKKYQNKIKAQREQSEALLVNILPVSIARRLKSGETVIADNIDSASVLFADISGFTSLSSKIKAKELLLLLNEIFSSFDELLMKYNLEKIKTIGDNYMLAAGVPMKDDKHAENIADMALDMIKIMPKINEETGYKLNIKIGINSGPVSAGVIGKKKFTYDIWGDTVNVASRMESFGNDNKIHVAEFTYRLLKNKYLFDRLEKIEIAGKGQMQTYHLLSKI